MFNVKDKVMEIGNNLNVRFLYKSKHENHLIFNNTTSTHMYALYKLEYTYISKHERVLKNICMKASGSRMYMYNY